MIVGPPDLEWVTSLVREEFSSLEITHVPSMTEVYDRLGDTTNLAFVACLVPLDGLTPSQLFTPLLAEDTRIILLTREKELTGVAALADRAKLDMITYLPEFNEQHFLLNIRHQILRYCNITGAQPPMTSPERDQFIFALPLSDDEIMAKIIESVDDCLGYQPRVIIPPGVRLTTEGKPVEEATLAIKGKVALERESHAGNVLMHHASTGQIIGLLALSSHRNAFFTSRTTTEVTGVHLTFEQINYVIQNRAETALLIAVLFIRSLDRRLRRSEEIQLEKVELMAQLEEEQANLARALTSLEAARAELMSQARFASLGELAAGVAHELNNPMAAIARTVEHLSDDIESLLASGQKKWAHRTITALTEAHDAPPISTKEARAIKRELTSVTKDAEMAQRLSLAGIRNPSFVKDVGRNRSDLETVEHAASIGTGLRNLESASRRITSLVASLRSYARPDGDPVADINIHETLDDTIRLVSHKLRGIEIIREYGDIPSISCHPGQLGQVWTNLMTNAAEAMAEAAGDNPNVGQLTITTRARNAHWIQVSISDTGPGIPEELKERIFEPRFTTKSGQIRYGMGIGLGLAKAIVDKHDGFIRLESTRDGTTAIVDLPVKGQS